MKKCLYCAEELEDEARFCSKCGKPQTEKKAEIEPEKTIENVQKKKPVAKKPAPAPKSAKKGKEKKPQKGKQKSNKGADLLGFSLGTPNTVGAGNLLPIILNHTSLITHGLRQGGSSDFNEKKREVYENLKAASPNDGSCEDKDCGYNNCYALAMRIAAGKEDYDSCPYTYQDDSIKNFFP